MVNKKWGLPKVPKNLWERFTKHGLLKAPSDAAWLGRRGQFFSPDLIIALILFIVILAFFFVSSNSMSVQIDLYSTKNQLDEFSHTVINPLVLFPGEPFNWEIKSFSDLNRVGLAKEKNVLDKEKVGRFVEFLTTDYAALRTKMSLGKYDFKFELQDFNGEIIIEAGYVNPSFTSRIVHKRIASYESRQVIVRGIISHV